MPKQVDHEARRQQIAEAVCRLAAREGLEAVSLRHVAAEAGVSMGLVQHYFSTKDQMLLFAFHTMGERFEKRMVESAAALPQPHTTRSLLRAMLVEMLPLSEDARAVGPLWIAFLSRAMVEPGLAGQLRASGGALREFVRDQLREAKRAGEIPSGLDPDLETATLLALVDGLMAHALIDPGLAETARRTLDYHLDRIFPEP
jgi:AcrR family transcriptional regulator